MELKIYIIIYLKYSKNFLCFFSFKGINISYFKSDAFYLFRFNSTGSILSWAAMYLNKPESVPIHMSPFESEDKQ